MWNWLCENLFRDGIGQMLLALAGWGFVFLIVWGIFRLYEIIKNFF